MASFLLHHKFLTNAQTKRSLQHFGFSLKVDVGSSESCSLVGLYHLPGSPYHHHGPSNHITATTAMGEEEERSGYQKRFEKKEKDVIKTPLNLGIRGSKLVNRPQTLL